MKISLDNAYAAVLMKDMNAENPALAHGLKLAGLFSIGLMIVAVEDDMSEARKSMFQDFVTKIGQKENVRTKFLLIDVPKKRKDLHVVEESGALTIVINVNEFGPKFIAKSCMCLKNPYFCITEKPEEIYSNIVIRATINKLSREKIIWAAFIAKKCNAKVTIVREQFEDEFLSKEVKEYMAFSRRHFVEQGVEYAIVDYDTKKSLLENCKYPESAFIYTTDGNCFMKAIFKIRTKEEKLIKEAKGYTLLFLNTNNEMYKIYDWK